jgi:serine/threonine protein kinase
MVQRGEVLNGYELVTDPTNAGGGMSQWAFATRDGGDYFVKLFLAPKFPLADGPGSAAAKERKRQACLAFEQRHVEIARRLDPSRPGAGNLVVATDFFRHDATYVKVMPRVRATALPEATELTGHQILVLLRSLAYSLRMLHDQQVVHGDIKPDNVMVEPGGPGVFVSKLIDFDEAYVVGWPPDADHIVGDPIYYAPELLRYIKRDPRLPADALGTAADMFSLGLLLHRFLTGRLPDFDRTTANYPAEALLGWGSLDIGAAPPLLRPQIARMLSVVPGRRPTIQQFIDVLGSLTPDQVVVDPAAPPTRMLVGASDDAAPPPRPTPSPPPGLQAPRPTGAPAMPAGPMPAGPMPAGPMPAGPMPRGPLPAGPTIGGSAPVAAPSPPPPERSTLRFSPRRRRGGRPDDPTSAPPEQDR